MTPAELQTAIEANASNIDRLTGAVDVLVSQFIRPNAQQAFSNFERLGRIEGILEVIATQQQANTQKIAVNADMITAIGESIEAFDQRLEATRDLVAQNSSAIAQLTVKQDQNANDIADLKVLVANMVKENQVFRESQQSQLAAIIGNGRRIDRLEAS